VIRAAAANFKAFYERLLTAGKRKSDAEGVPFAVGPQLDVFKQLAMMAAHSTIITMSCSLWSS